MFGIHADTKAIDKLLDKFSESKLDAIAEETVKNLGSIVKNVARDLAPYDTGALRGSIDLEITGEGQKAIAEVGTPLDYGYWQEYGSTKNKAVPYLRPALDEAREVAQEVTKAVMNKHAK